jgi:hypothetical protein
MVMLLRSLVWSVRGARDSRHSLVRQQRQGGMAGLTCMEPTTTGDGADAQGSWPATKVERWI